MYIIGLGYISEASVITFRHYDRILRYATESFKSFVHVICVDLDRTKIPQQAAMESRFLL